MQIILSIVSSLFLSVTLFSQNLNPNFDSTLAKKIGADDYGMKNYILVILKTGDNKTTDKSFIDSCFRGHLSNIRRLAEDGKLVLAGPIGKNENQYRGIFILNVRTIDEAREIVMTDPAVNSDLLKAYFYSWYGSAALPEYLELAKKLESIILSKFSL